MENIPRILDAILSDEISSFFSGAVALWLIVAVLCVFHPTLARRSRCAKFAAISPSALATLGVLGTFAGILIGLLDFDVGRVDDSVPQLLAGLKIAFTTSLVGLFAAVSFRVALALAPATDAAAAESITPEHIYQALLHIRADGREAASRSTQALIDLRKAIASDGDSSLLTQIQKLRTTVQDGQQELTCEFREFARQMTDNNQKAIVEALEQVIRDFNQNLTEQFGDNFKQLNEAVHALVDWQERYREHLETLQSRLEHAVAAIEASQEALESVESHAERIPEAIKPLEPALNGVNAQTNAMNAHLEALVALRDQSLQAFPIIEENLEKLTTQFSTGIENAVAASQQALDDAKTTHEDLRQEYADFLNDAGQARERFSNELTETLERMSKQSAEEFSRHQSLIAASAEEAQRSVNESWAASVDKMNEQFTAFDDQMQEELKRALEALGRNLASVSEKLVADYTPLTQRLRDLIELADGADRRERR